MSFELIGEQLLPELEIRLQTFRHPCGLQHVHVVADDPESAFAVVFPTPPTSHDGRAHILEHMVLSGSRKYPDGQTFQAMTQRSLASFMNAMTYSERTVYPFSTADLLDFENLLDVYLDATFFPLLRKEDFLQEGWRHVLRDPNGPLEVDGVVYNEMKGAMAGRERVAIRQAMAVLLEGTAYAFESGGDSLNIPELTYEELVAFHRQHYHPSQAIAFSYGQFDPDLVQSRLLEVIAQRQDPAVNLTPPALVSTLTEPVRATVAVPQGEDEDAQEHSALVGWVLGPTFENDTGLVTVFMAQALMGGDASPLTQRMSQQGFGRPSSLAGPDTENHEVSFWTGMDGLTAEQVPMAEALVRSTLEQVAHEGLPQSHLQATFRELEVMSRDMGNRMPLGVEMILGMVTPTLAGANPAWAIDPAQLTQWEERLTDPGFVAEWVRQNLLDNPRRAHVVVEPQANWHDLRQQQEQAMLQVRLDSWSPAQRQAVIDELAAFEARPAGTHDTSKLPIIDLGRVSREPLARLPHVFSPASSTHTAQLFVRASTRGIGHATVYLDLSEATADQGFWIDLTLGLMENLAMGELDWIEAAHWRNERLQGFKASTAAFSMQAGLTHWLRHASIRGQVLERHSQGAAEALADTLLKVRFDDTERLTFLVREQHEALRAATVHLGNRLAAQEAAAPLSPLALAHQQANGRPMLAFLDSLVQQLETDPSAVVAQLEQTHRFLLAQPRMVMGAGSPAFQATLEQLAQRLSGAPAWRPLGTGVDIPALPETPPFALVLVGSTPVQFCHQSWPTVGQDHPDTPVLEVLAEALQNGPLHVAIREQGSAYGAGAHASNGFFTVNSYRDPRLKGTFDDFERVVEASKRYDWSAEELHQAKLSVLQRLTAPQSPAKRASSSVALLMSNMSDAQRKAFRTGILEATGEDLRRVAGRYLVAERANRVAFSGKTKAKEVPGFAIEPVWPTARTASRSPSRR